MEPEIVPAETDDPPQAKVETVLPTPSSLGVKSVVANDAGGDDMVDVPSSDDALSPKVSVDDSAIVSPTEELSGTVSTAGRN